jgi:hypothetical protein
MNKIHTAMYECDWDIDLSAEILGVTPARLRKFIEHYKMNFPMIPPIIGKIPLEESEPELADDGELPDNLL